MSIWREHVHIQGYFIIIVELVSGSGGRSVFSPKCSFNVSLNLLLLIVIAEIRVGSSTAREPCWLNVKQWLLVEGIVIGLMSNTFTYELWSCYIWCNLIELGRYFKAPSQLYILDSCPRWAGNSALWDYRVVILSLAKWRYFSHVFWLVWSLNWSQPFWNYNRLLINWSSGRWRNGYHPR